MILAYRTNWLWGTFAVPAADGIVGANMVDRPHLPDQEEESCLWAPGRCEPLADIEFQQQAGGANAPWALSAERAYRVKEAHGVCESMNARL